MDFEKGDWILKKWYHKTIYVVGIIWVALFLFGVLIGFVGAFYE